MSPKESANIASHLATMAALDPARMAIIAPEGRTAWTHLTFGELEARSNALAQGLQSVGIVRGTRAILMAPPSLDFFPLVFALFKIGAVPVLIDPGIGRRALLSCLAEVEAEAFIGVPMAHLARILCPQSFRKVSALVTVGRRWFWGGHSLDEIELRGIGAPPHAIEPADGETAAILFTSGSTGIPKGVVYTHAMFDAQVRMIRATYGIEPGEIDLPTFPLFALFDPALGMTAVLPRMDFRYPYQAHPDRIIDAITTHRCTSMFASPSLLDNLGRHGVAQRVKLPTLRRVLCAGAPVRPDVLENMTQLLSPPAQVFTPFGATESLPVTSIGSDEVLRDTAAGAASGKGLCVGHPVDGALVRIIRITDEPIATWSDALLVPAETMGEITVRGEMVTHAYHARPEQTRAAKIREGQAIVHRMGDVGYFDAVGRLWMCGRKGQRVETKDGTLFTVPIEEVFNRHPAVRRTALVGIGPRGAQRPILLVEREREHEREPGRDTGTPLSDALVLAELADLGSRHEATRGITNIQIYPHRYFPVDTRHQAKIEREKLAAWAAERWSR